VLRSVWLTCVLTVASASAWAQPAQPTAAAAVAISVERAQQNAVAAERKVVQLTTQRVQLRRHHDGQLDAVDRLKKQKASWRRDRELNKAQADANDTAKRLTALDHQIKLAQQELTKQRGVVVRAIDSELAAGATGPRAAQLGKLRAQLAPAMTAPKKIVIPDAEIDPLADPEELDRQAAAIAAAEKQLEAQRKGLDQQHKDLKLVAEVRSAHDRAGELATRDDDQPHRGAPRGSSRGDAESVTAGSPSNDSAGGSSGGGAGSGSSGGGTTTDPTPGESFGDTKTGTSSTFETGVAVALGEVIDKTTIEGMLRASRSGDPKQRAEAAKQARDAVAKRLELLKKKRAMIEARAKQLRH
jgi:hypothetical protein